MLRRAAAVRLDIDERELQVGLRVLRDATGRESGQLFVADALENGAGYASFLGRPGEMERVFQFIVGQSTDRGFYDFLVSPAHASNCQTSCPDCLRDYSNLAFHSILDWRLGLDLARLALDPVAPIDLNVTYWQPLMTTPVRSCFPKPGWTWLQVGGLPAGHRRNVVEFLVHPMWRTEIPGQHSAVAQAIVDTQTRFPGAKPKPRPVFELLRRPY
jgi:hypothetical protein